MSFAGLNNLLSCCIKNISWLGCRGRHRTHYDVLKLRKNCTTKQIKESYIKLSKQCHPDVNKDKKSHDTFVQIGEAYKILSKPHTRAQYDTDLLLGRRNTYVSNTSYDHWQDASVFSFWSRGGDGSHGNKSYYGFRGVKKVPNSYIVVLCLIAASFGVVIEIYMLINASDHNRIEMDRKSAQAEDQLRSVRSEANFYGKEAQIERMRERLNVGINKNADSSKQFVAPAAVVLPDADAVIPDAAAVIPDAAAVLPDVTAVEPDVTAMLTDTVAMLLDAVDKPDVVVLPDAAVMLPDAAAMLPDAAAVLPDAAAVLPDVTAVEPDATAVLPDVTAVLPASDVKKPSNLERKEEPQTVQIVANGNDGEHVTVNVEFVDNIQTSEGVGDILNDAVNETKNVITDLNIDQNNEVTYNLNLIDQLKPYMYDYEKNKFNENIDEYLDYIYNLQV